MIEEIDKKIISQIQRDLPVHPRPFALLAEKIGISEEVFVERVKRLKEKGVIRRFGATLRHQEAGFKANAMIAWKSPEDAISENRRKTVPFQRGFALLSQGAKRRLALQPVLNGSWWKS